MVLICVYTENISSYLYLNTGFSFYPQHLSGAENNFLITPSYLRHRINLMQQSLIYGWCHLIVMRKLHWKIL